MENQRYSKVRIIQDGEQIVIEASCLVTRHAFLWEYNQNSGKLVPLGAELSRAGGEQIEQLMAELQVFLDRNGSKTDSSAQS